MNRYEEPAAKARWLRIFKHCIIGISITGGMALILFVVVYGDHGYTATKQSKAYEQRLMEELKAKQQQNKALQEEIRRLKEDPQTIEKIARETHGLIGPNDVVIKLAEPTPPAGERATERR